MADAVVFDLFHTLVDPDLGRPAGYDPVALIADCLGVDDEAFGTFWTATFVERETTPIDVVDLVDRFATSVGAALTVEQRHVVDRVLGHHRDGVLANPRPDVIDLIERLAEVTRLGLLSNAYEREVRAWSASPLARFFDAAVFSCDVGAMKPNPRTYSALVASLAIEAGQAVFVGNGASGELVGARASGFGFVVHCNVFDQSTGFVTKAEQRERAAQADVSVHSFDELGVVLGL